MPPNTVARQVRCVYGTRDAGKLWEDTYTQVLECLGFVTTMSNPCVFHHPGKDIPIVIHGGDLTALGTDDNLNWYENKLKESFEIKIRGRLGEGCKGPQEIRILNRMVSITDEGLLYEADPRHAEMLIKAFHLENGKSVVTPGLKTHDPDADLEKMDSDADAAAEIHRIISSLKTKPRPASRVRFDPDVKEHDVPAYSHVYVLGCVRIQPGPVEVGRVSRH